VELAEFEGERGCMSRSFVNKAAGEDLVHGSEVLAGKVRRYDKSMLRGQSDHSVANIFMALRETVSAENLQRDLVSFGGFLVLDALICNTDRHHDNWGVLRIPQQKGSAQHVLAPSFDHASSLGRELLEDRMRRILNEGRILQYAFRGRGGVFLNEGEQKGANPIKLVEKCVDEYRNLIEPWLQKVRELELEQMEEMVRRVPDAWMGEPTKTFCMGLLSATRERLVALL